MEFHGDYKALWFKLSYTLISMKDNLLLRALMLDDIDHERQDQSNKEMAMKLKKYKNGYVEIPRLLEAL